MTIKQFLTGTHRAVPPDETIERAKRVLGRIGVTRVAEITGLDRIEIPVFTAFRPSAPEGSISVYNGKGLTPLEAEASAVMEAVERASANMTNDRLCWFTLQEIKDQEIGYLSPELLILPPNCDTSGRRLPWVEGVDLGSDERIYVPADAVFFPGGWNENPLIKATSNGLAAGNTFDEAIVHALCELIERDALSLYRLRRNGVEVDPGKAPEAIAGIVQEFSRADITLHIKWITQEVPVPTFAVVADDRVARSPAFLTLGAGTHPDRDIALIRALTENAQSRATLIQGAREDVVKRHAASQSRSYEETKKRLPYWFEPNARSADLVSLPTLGFLPDFEAERQRLLELLVDAGFQRIIAVDLTLPELDIPVVRVVVPGLEVCGIDATRVGPRAVAASREKSKLCQDA